MPAGSTSSETERVDPIVTHIQVYNTYTATAGGHAEYRHENKQQQWPHPVQLSG